MSKFLITIVGPTAIGKTALGIELAQAFDCEIISCDSRQFYREMAIGTAVPEADELAAATHHFIHNKSIFERYTVGDFETDAIAKLDELFETRDVAVMVGGSGLYVDAVLNGFDEFPEIDSAVRAAVSADYAKYGLTHLQSEVRKYDPYYFAEADIQNPQRMMRALEVCIGTGQPYSSFRKRETKVRRFTPIVIGLDAPRGIIYDRIDKRVDIMLEKGLVEEAQAVYPYRQLNALQTVGYRELFDYFDGKTNLETAVEAIKTNTRRFAKRQLTWFRRNNDTTWFAFDDRLSIHAYIANTMSQKSR
ncbi:tRNA (adenosine(37)-N6)-dimethylallyltransferase MiaA [Flavobacterium selenitireducens]|uniref:tRNA (adenosine(37)-N6)-dimethylallyltransferase MiaA n=1 Tax=Flavobacterium selenitireducens TaxID=2722704 RepID=UPI00168A5D80|nr:tRNA (adenosine(37)-N6)-dimethylallyltransferase MiaA [Flavobacterium selenitireducens]MBD3582961.1 tRNA (adenosine(37)-N6)-dimethylallyltransferase MiaA [Flavobacterium selenitireducens]